MQQYRIIMECNCCDFRRNYTVDGFFDVDLHLSPALQHQKESGHVVTTEIKNIVEVVQ